MKKWLGSKRFGDDKELKTSIVDQLYSIRHEGTLIIAHVSGCNILNVHPHGRGSI